MKSTVFAIFMLMVALSLVLMHMPNNVLAIGTSNQTAMITINGTVRNDTNQPLALEFDFSNGTQLNQEFTSSQNGLYNFHLKPGWWNWKFASDNQQPGMPRFFEVQKSFDLTSNDSESLVPDIFTISGTVKDSNSNLISGASIDSGVCPITVGSFVGSQEDVVTTATNGSYTLHLLPSTCDSLKVVTPTGLTFFPSVGRTLNINSNITDNIILATPVTVSGTTKDSSNNPLQMTVQWVGTDFVESATSNSTGYSFNIPTGQYTLKFSQSAIVPGTPRFFDLERAVTVSSNQVNNVKLNTTSVSGTVSFTSSQVDVRNPISGSLYNGFSSDRVTTDSSGHFTANLLQSPVSTITITDDTNETTKTCSLSGGTITCP